MRLGFFTSLWIRGSSPRGFVLALCWMLLFGLCAPAQAKRIALVIGNDAYEHVNKLQKAGNDAAAMARELSAAGFEVQLHLNLNYRSMVRAVEALSKRITGGDEVVVFFAGHGVQIKTGSFMLPTDIEATTESEVEKTAYGVNDLTEKLSEAKAAFALVVVDACRDNPLKAAGRSVGNSRGLSAIEPPKGQMVIYSASRGQQALDRLNDKDPNPNGVFTREFIAKMRKPGLKIEDLVRDVQDSVEALAQTIKHEQRPAIYNEARGNFYFFGPTTVQVAPPAPVAPVAPAAPAAVTAEQEERVFWEDAKAAGNQEAYEAYLESYPKGRYASLARANLARLNAAKAAAQKLAADAAAERANKAEQDRRAAEEAQKAAQRAASERVAAEAAVIEQQRLAMEAQAKEQTRLALLAQESARVAAEAAQKLAAARLAELPKPGQVIKDCADCPEMVVLPAGSFTMGSSAAEQALANAGGVSASFTSRESPQHSVNIRSFAAARYAISKGEFAAFVRAKGYQTEAEQGDGCFAWNGKEWKKDKANNWRKPSFTQSDNHPVVCVSWNDAQAYIAWLNQSTGKTFRLLSESEREYAARADTRSAFWWGDSISTAQANYNGTATGYNGSPKGEYRQATVPVNSFSPNPFGLYNVHGNVWEWVEDCWHDNYTGAPADGSAWTTACSGSSRGLRGGSWYDLPSGLRSAHRDWDPPDGRSNGSGFRLARTLHTQSPASNAIPSIAGPPLKIAFAYVGPIGDGGWTYAHELGRKAIEKEFGDKVKISFTENVPESADAERVFRDMASQGNKLIFGTTFGYMEPMLKVAPDFKDVKFEHAIGYKQAANLRTYDSRTYEGAYMAGVIAGKMSKTNTLGVVASIPIPEVIRNINSFTLGAQSVNPKVKTKVVWVNSWFDPPKETEAATSLINGGADVLLQNTDSPAVLKTAEAKGKRAFGWDSDMTAYGPKAHLGSAVNLWGPYYIEATRQALNGSWKGDTGVWWGVKEGAIDMVSIAEDVPADTKARVAEIKKGLADGSFAIWKGPITDNTGKVQIAAGSAASDRFLAGMSFYVRGVEGRVPGGN